LLRWADGNPSQNLDRGNFYGRQTSNKHARAAIMKRDNSEDEMEKITKADAQILWDAARDAYIKRHNLTFATGAFEFATTQEAKVLYSKYLAAQPGPPIAKKAAPLSKAQEVAAQMDVTCEVMAKQAFPNDNTPIAVAKFLGTDSGKEFYTGYLEEKAAVGVR
jgi:hypothetical protein